ncbi:hypothetical protein LINPERHAP1_LOCUS26961 [Linum perenne]
MEVPTKFAAAALLLAVMFCHCAGQGFGPCDGDMFGLIMECDRYIQEKSPYIEPSPACCAVLRTVDVPCICRRIPAGVASIVDMDKVAHVAESCGAVLPHGLKCGGKSGRCVKYNEMNIFS